MIRRREFVHGVGLVGANFLLPRVATAAPVQPAPLAPISPSGDGPPLDASLVAAPAEGLGANHNYFIYAGGDPIRDLSAEIVLTEDFTAEAGFSLQFNGWSPAGSNTTWQQYNYGFYTEDKAKPQISWSMENWPSMDYLAHLHQTIGLPTPSDLFNIHGQRVTVPGGFTVPAGYKFKIALVHDPKDATGAVIGAKFSVVDHNGKTIINDSPLIRSYKFSSTSTSVDAAALAPIITAQLNICARAGSVYGFMKSGGGTIAYSASNPLTMLSAHPDGMAAPTVITAESANTVYSQLPAAPSPKFAQTFTTIKAPSFRIGNAFAASRRSGANRADLFAVSVTGQLTAFTADAAGGWKRSTDYGPLNMAQPNTTVAAVTPTGAGAPTSVFLVDQHGQLQAFSASASTVKGPTPAGARDFARKGAPIAALSQSGAQAQTAVFLFDATGQLNVFSARGAAALTGPVKIGPAAFAPQDAQLVAVQQASPMQTAVFAIDKSGTLSRFSTTGSGGWNGPEKISAPDFAKPGAHVAVVRSTAASGRTDVFAFDKRGELNVFSSSKAGEWSMPVPIGPKALADPGAAIAVLPGSTPDQTSVFVADKQGALTVLSTDTSGEWGAPQQIGQPGATSGGAWLVVSPQSVVAGSQDVFVISNGGTAGSGWPTVTSTDERGVWSGPAKIAPDV